MITANGLIQLGFTPLIDFALQNDGGDTYIREWLSEKSQPSEKEITDADAIWQSNYDANQYQRDRQYPEIGEQLDMLFHDMTAGKGTKSGEWYKAVAKVKADNPKPE